MHEVPTLGIHTFATGSPDMRLILGGMVAGVPGHGGATWAALQYALGLRALGHDVLLLDEVRGPGDPAARAACLAHVVEPRSAWRGAPRC